MPQWYSWMRRPPPARRFAPLVGVVIGLLVGALFLLDQKIVFGSIVIAIAIVIGMGSMLSPSFAQRLDRIFELVGRWAAKIVSWLLLAPLFLIVFTGIRLWNRLTRRDPLQLRPCDEPSYWLPSDSHARKVRYASAMFASDRIQRRSLGWAAAAVLALLAVIIAEGTLRLKGFGKPILYEVDGAIGFYPRPNQVTRRDGGRVAINAFGMRGPQYAREKAEGVFRILMLGDSTLYGGSYVDQEELYSRQLERHLRGLAHGRRVEVLAMGVNAWGPFHELGYVERFGTFDADLAIVALPIPDIERPLYGLEAVPFLSAQRPPRLALEEVANHLAWRLRTRQIGALPKQQSEWHAQRGIEAYARLAKVLTSRGAEVMFEVLPSQRTAAGTPVEREVANVTRFRTHIASNGNFPISFPVGLFRNAAGKLYHDHVHLDVDGHRLYAVYLRDSVARNSARWKQWNAASPGTQRAEVTR